MNNNHNNSNVFVVGVCGSSASGKTSVVSKVVQSLLPHHVSVIDQDSFYKDFSMLPDDERARINFDHPDTIDFAELYSVLYAIKSGRPSSKPCYDFITHSRQNHRQLVISARIVIVEGLHIFGHEGFRDLIDHRIFIDVDSDIRFIRRLIRDIDERGRTMHGVIAQYLSTVRPMDLLYVQPLKKYAHVVFTQENIKCQTELLVDMLRSLANE